MSIEIRPPLTDEEWEQHCFISAYAFDGDRGETGTARRSKYYERSWALSAFDDGQIAAGMMVIPFEQYLNGARIPLGGVASVSCLPERRRGGYVGALLRRSLETMREAGQPLSALWTPHPSLYRRFGWEMAARMVGYAFPPKVTHVRRPAERGRWERLTPDDWPRFDAIYTQHHQARNGGMTRNEQRWRWNVFEDYAAGKVRDAAIWANDAGQPRGYVIYSTRTRSAATFPFVETLLQVHDWAALDAAAYAAVLTYLLNHDLASRITMLASQDDPLPDALEVPAHLSEPPGAWFGIMLRLVDVQRAIEARPALPQASGKGVTIALTDRAAPWNAGTWRIGASEGRMSAERTTTAPDLEMDVCALAPIYNGFTRPAEAVRTGSVSAASDDAIAAATELFASTYSPYCPDDF